jgi:NAD(P)-dependent dehydrogenase (short-subunit alcohol dehydrogenase family)
MTDNGVLAGQTAFVPGGSGGIGGACAERFVRDGAAVLIMARDATGLARQRDALLAAYPQAQVGVHAGDACNESDVQAALAAAYALRQRLDIIVPTVGGGGGFRPLLSYDLTVFRDIIERNLMSTFLAVRHGAPLMKHGGAIVCLSATSARRAIANLAAAAAAKGAIESFVLAAAEELGPMHIRVNAVRPGLTISGNTATLLQAGIVENYVAQTPLASSRQQAGTPQNVADAIRYLAGPESAWVTGQSIAVDGGMELRRHPQLDIDKIK